MGRRGKGKATDLLGSRVDYVVGVQRSNNAGHTVVIDQEDGRSEKYALHLLPSGIPHPGCTPVIGNGVVIDLEVLFEELEGLVARGVGVAACVDQCQRARDRRLQPHAGRVTERFLGKAAGSARPAAASARRTPTR